MTRGRPLDHKGHFSYTLPVMKANLHPEEYRAVVFEDLSNGFRFLTRSTIKTEETTKWEDGNEYPLVKVHISSASHPYFTGQEKLVDIEGRVDKFRARQEAAKKAAEEKAARLAAQKSKPAKKPKVDETVKIEAKAVKK